MPLDYESIRKENKGRYGWDIGRIGNQIFADNYADRTHFIFELLQNAEDALGRRAAGWNGSRTVTFNLSQRRLRVSHFGDPFNEKDVRGICGIAESEKKEDLRAIGRFGIGFKSVYAFTDRPEIHSGTEDFVIKSFVWPKAAPKIHGKRDDKTVIQLPFKPEDESGYEEISEGLRNLGSRTLLFLRHIEEIAWNVEGGGSGCYLRESKPVDDNVRKVTVIGQADGDDDAVEEWLIFSREVCHDTTPAGRVEIAFEIDSERKEIRPIQESSHLVVFFPTVLDTHLGFLIQGPYRTTPNRDNVPLSNSWNKCLVAETASLLQDALRWLRDRSELDTDVLRCLPLERYGTGPLAPLRAPLFEATKQALSTEPLLPRFGGGYTLSSRALLSRSEALRELFSPSQLATLYTSRHDLAWISGDITQDRAQNVRMYLMQELGISETVPEIIVRKLTRQFLESQSDEWVRTLYEFLNVQPRLQRHLNDYDIPIVRLDSGKHVVTEMDGVPQAFLPSDAYTDFPTVAQSVCKSEDARSFLQSLGLNEPDLVDDVILNLLPKYQQNGADSDIDHEKDLDRILKASKTDSSSQRCRLISKLQETTFVPSVDAGEKTNWLATPDHVYLATERLKRLFDGISEVLFPDEANKSLLSKGFCKLLSECGASDRLQRIEFTSEFTYEEKLKMRIDETGHGVITRECGSENWTLRGLDGLLRQLPTLKVSRRREKAKWLWKELAELAEFDRGAFFGTYSWFYYTTIFHQFDAHFVEQLNETPWVPNAEGELKLPSETVFSDLNWSKNDFLQSKIKFKVPVERQENSAVDHIARVHGIEPEAIKLIKKYDLTAAKLQELISTNEPEVDPGEYTEVDGPTPSFAKLFYGVQTPNPPDAPDRPVILPGVGPETRKSAIHHTILSDRLGRHEAHVPRVVKRSELGPQGTALENEFRDMVQGDYGKRCQVCGDSFAMPANSELQVFVVHIVPPRRSHRTNHFGDLLGLCGRHYALVRYGAWSLSNPETHRPFEDVEQMRASVLAASEKTDFNGNPYFGLSIQFANVYQNWSEDPTTVTEEVRYSGPHWKYLCELLKT